LHTTITLVSVVVLHTTLTLLPRPTHLLCLGEYTWHVKKLTWNPLQDKAKELHVFKTAELV